MGQSTSHPASAGAHSPPSHGPGPSPGGRHRPSTHSKPEAHSSFERQPNSQESTWRSAHEHPPATMLDRTRKPSRRLAEPRRSPRPVDLRSMSPMTPNRPAAYAGGAQCCVPQLECATERAPGETQHPGNRVLQVGNCPTPVSAGSAERSRRSRRGRERLLLRRCAAAEHLPAWGATGAVAGRARVLVLRGAARSGSARVFVETGTDRRSAAASKAQRQKPGQGQPRRQPTESPRSHFGSFATPRRQPIGLSKVGRRSCFLSTVPGAPPRPTRSAATG